MQWLPTYLARNLGAEKHDIMFTAVPYVMNSLVGMGMYDFTCVFVCVCIYFDPDSVLHQYKKVIIRTCFNLLAVLCIT